MNIIGFNQYCRMLSEGSQGTERLQRIEVSQYKKLAKRFGVDAPETNAGNPQSWLQAFRRHPMGDRIMLHIRGGPVLQHVRTVQDMRSTPRKSEGRARALSGAIRRLESPTIDSQTRETIEQAIRNDDHATLARFASMKPLTDRDRMTGSGTIPQSAELQRKIAVQQQRNRVRGIE